MDKMGQMLKNTEISVNSDRFGVTIKTNKNLKYRNVNVCVLVVCVMLALLIAVKSGINITYDNIYYYKYLAIVTASFCVTVFTPILHLK